MKGEESEGKRRGEQRKERKGGRARRMRGEEGRMGEERGLSRRVMPVFVRL